MERNQKRVLIVSHLWPNSYQPERGIYVQREAKKLAESYKISILNPKPWLPFVPEKFLDGYVSEARMVKNKGSFNEPHCLEVSRPPMLKIPKISLFSDFQYSRLIHSYSRVFQPNLIHAQCLLPSGVAAVRAGKKLGIKTLVTVRAGDLYKEINRGLRTRNRMLEALDGADEIISMAPHYDEYFEQLGFNRDSKLLVISNGVDTATFYPKNQNNLKKSMGIDSSTKLYVFVGSVIPRKNIAEFAKIFVEYWQITSEPIQLLIIGQEGPDLDKILLLEHNYPNVIKYVGAVEQKTLPDYLNAADYLALPSLLEGSPNAVIEALACGTPVIGSKIPSIEQFVDPKKNGLLHEPADRASILNVLGQSIDLAFDRKSIALDAQQQFGRQHDKVSAVYDRLLS